MQVVWGEHFAPLLEQLEALHEKGDRRVLRRISHALLLMLKEGAENPTASELLARVKVEDARSPLGPPAGYDSGTWFCGMAKVVEILNSEDPFTPLDL
ncbi:MAG TPA: hypothetical protein VFZ48_00880 [Candidatus Saccharimonadales bacterium]